MPSAPVFCFCFLLLFLFADGAAACGWWGDSEMTSRRETALTGPDGTPVEQVLSLANMKLPGRMGYGIAVPDPGRAVPYLLATFGQPLDRIRDLSIFGFRAVIDIGTKPAEAKRHEAETRDAGMRYFNILFTGGAPSAGQVTQFSEIVLDPGNAPLLVYAAKAELIGAMWAAYRLNLGAPLEFSIHEGKRLGMTQDQEAALRSGIASSKR